jgi:hypothetical protein
MNLARKISAVWLSIGAVAAAHESPVDHVERRVQMTVVDGHLQVRYRIEVAERNAMLQLDTMDADRDGRVSDIERDAYFQRQADDLADKLKLEIESHSIKLVADAPVELDPRLGQTYQFTAPLDLPVGGRLRCRLNDGHARYLPGPYRLVQPRRVLVDQPHVELKERPQLVDLERHPGQVVVDFEIVAPKKKSEKK